MKRGLVCLILVLSACSAATPPPPSIPYALDAGGVQLLDRDQRIDFGRTDHSTESAMAKLVGSGPTESGSCAGGARYLTWKDGTTLIFTRGDFRGWQKGDTRAGLGCV